MDEGLLNDLLECSVCLERLDTSSRVLPCQHTFCLKCLKVIVESHKELRCPECRVLVEARVEELPPNVLLMRILEGMKNAAPRKVLAAARSARLGHSLAPTQQSVQQSTRGDGKQLPPHARAMHDYISKEPGDLSFKKGETILLQKKLDAFWYQGECSGRSGTFPITYVQVIVPLPAPTALCKALYDFRMSAPDEEGCLAFDRGAIITVHRRVDDNWAEGRLEQRVGIFPIAFVELNQPARQLMNSAPLNRPVPPVPEHSRAGHSDHRHHAQHPHRYQQMSLSTPASAQANYQNVANMSQSHPNYQIQQVLAHHAQPSNILEAKGAHQIQQMLAQFAAPSNVSEAKGAHQIQQMLAQFAAPSNILEAAQAKGAHQIQQMLAQHAAPSNILEAAQAKSALESIQFTNLHNKTSHAGVNLDRVRPVKYESITSTPVHKGETAYQNVSRPHEHAANFTNASSDSSSSANTPSTSSPNTSSDTSTCDSADPSLPSLPSSPDNNADRNHTVTACDTTHNRTADNEGHNSLETSLGVLNLNESSTATNTSLNVSLPPTAESPKSNGGGGCAGQALSVNGDSPSNSEINRTEAPTSSKSIGRSSGPDSLLTFGLGLQAALSPAREGGGAGGRGRDAHHPQYQHREREKRHSLTPATHSPNNHSGQNRHSAEIVATSLLDHAAERGPRQGLGDGAGSRQGEGAGAERGERRRRRERSGDRTLPAAYVALYPYKPQKSDELELRKGGIYTVTERCRDGWYKGWAERGGGGGAGGGQRGGVFPGNYVTPAQPPHHTAHTAHQHAHAHPHAHHNTHRAKHDKNATNPSPATVKLPASGPAGASGASGQPPPDAPPREESPVASTASQLSYPWAPTTQSQQGTPKSEKSKDKSKSDKSSISSGVSLMKRLAAMKKCKSPPPAAAYSLDNPVFEDGPGTSLAAAAPEQHHPVQHVRSGSCPSQLLRVAPPRARASPSTPAALATPATPAPPAVAHEHYHHLHRASNEGPWQSQHRKSQSLDVTAARRDRDRHHSQPAKERFRCIVPYPPNSEYELELKVDDIVLVSKKRGDGWYKGTLQRTGRTGLFPASFVQSCPHE